MAQSWRQWVVGADGAGDGVLKKMATTRDLYSDSSMEWRGLAGELFTCRQLWGRLIHPPHLQGFLNDLDDVDINRLLKYY